MGRPKVVFKIEPEVKVWEARKPRRIRPEPKPTYVRVGGEIFEALGRVDNRKSNESIVCLVHILTRRHFLGGNYGTFAAAIKQGRIELLNEMEVLAWVASTNS